MEKVYAEQLSDIQGLILSAYGHLNSAAFLFLHARDTAAAQRWLGAILDDVTPSKPWDLKPTGEKHKPQVALNLAFTLEGLQQFGLSPETLGSFPQEFREGMAARAGVLGDDGPSAPAHWELGGPTNPAPHVLLMLYATDAARLEVWVETQRARIAASAGGLEEISSQRGQRQPSGKEPFGFHDGLSQPVIEGIERHHHGDPVPAVKAGEFILGYLNEYGTYPVSPVVAATADPGQLLPAFPDGALPAYRDFGCNGSYLVYRKLEQNVARFWNFMEEQTKADPDAMVRLASKCVGRWPSGAPVTVSPDRDEARLGNANDFLYTPRDPLGHGCPIGAHVRRVNPRDSLLNDNPTDALTTCRRHRIIRRGIPYGPPPFPPETVEPHHAPVHLKDDGHARGLHFIAVNAGIARQFEFLNQTWVNDPTFAALLKDKDPIVGNNDGTTYMTIQRQPIRERIANIPRFVSVKGGGYFFLPSLRALRFLSQYRAGSKS